MSRRLAVTVIVLTLELAATGCLSTRPVAANRAADDATSSLGSIEVSSPHFGQMTLVPTSCSAGARRFFLGGDFADEKAGVVVRLVVDPLASPAIKVFSAAAPFDKGVVFRRDECSVFHFSLDSTGWFINHIEDYRITLNVDCSRNGETVRGTASATHCH